MQFHVLSFEGPDPYARAGGLASRVDGLVHALGGLGFATHLWFVGDPALPGEEVRGNLTLHRWGQWISRWHPAGVYAVLANSGHEPFGLVGLEAMAAGGVACTGCSGEDYVVPGQNALVLETEDPLEFLGLYEGLRSRPERVQSLRRTARATARRYAWPEVVEKALLPRIALT